MFEELDPPYSTITADPPWAYDEGWPKFGDSAGDDHERTPLPYSSMSVTSIVDLPVVSLAAPSSCLFLWTTNRYLRQAFEVMDAWGFRYSQTVVWCKEPHGVGPGGMFAITTEFVLVGRRGSTDRKPRVPTSWFVWPRGAHSAKPAAFGDLVEQVSPPPYLELFARAPRLGWDSWGRGFETMADVKS